MALLSSSFANPVCTWLAASSSSWMTLFVRLGWLSPGVAGVTVSHSIGQTGPFHVVLDFRSRKSMPFLGLCLILCLLIILAGVSHMTSPVPGGGEK